MTSIDFSKPLATLLRDGTLEIHDSVATSVGAKLLLSGGLSREEYARYLMILWHVYEFSVLLFLLFIFTDLPIFSQVLSRGHLTDMLLTLH